MSFDYAQDIILSLSKDYVHYRSISHVLIEGGKMKKFCLLTCLISLFVLVNAITVGAESKVRPSEKRSPSSLNILKSFGVSEEIAHYFQINDTSIKTPPKLSLLENILVACIDIVVSLLCLWLALVLVSGTWSLDFNRYMKFLLFFNIVWFGSLVLFKLLWAAFDYLVIKLQPDMAGIISRNFAIAVISLEIIVYLWLLARVFSMKFFGILLTCVITQLFYFTIIFLIVTFIPMQDSQLFGLLKNNLGFKAEVNRYFSNLYKLTSGENVISLVQLKAYHI